MVAKKNLNWCKNVNHTLALIMLNCVFTAGE